MTQPLKELNVLHVTYDMGIGGTEQVIVNLVTLLTKWGIHNSVYCLEKPVGALGQSLAKQGVVIETSQRRPKLDINLVLRLRRYIRNQKINIVHCHQYTPYVYGLLASIGTASKVVFTEHGRFYPDQSSWKRRLINPLFQKFTANIIAISEATKESLVRIENFSPDRVKTIHNGIRDLSEANHLAQSAFTRNKLGIKGDSLTFGTIARLDPIKNQAMMLRAFSKVNQILPNAKMIIVGDGPIKKELVKLAETKCPKNSVLFTGFDPEPQRYLAAMDVFLLPSLSEGTSMTLLEAMSFSKPSIVSDAGGNPEIITNNATGLLTPAEDELSLVEAMIRLGSDPKLRARLGKSARKTYEERFNLEAMGAQYHQLYQKCRDPTY